MTESAGALSRRSLLRAAGLLGTTAVVRAATPAPGGPVPVPDPQPLHLKFAVKIGMVHGDGSLQDKFALLKSVGFDGVELDSPQPGYDAAEVRAATEATGLPVHGVVNSTHWQVRLSDPDGEVRAQARRNLETAIRESEAFGGSSVLLVPGRVSNPDSENHQQVWDRSIEQIRRTLPLAAELGVHILIENVWNAFCYEHNGPSDQSAALLRDYLDAIDSPWVGSYFDLGNHRKYGLVQDWIRTLGRRIVKLDVKDWGQQANFCKIGDGDVDWPEVRSALADIGYTGWATAEVGGGDETRLREIKERMDRALRIPQNDK